MGYLNLCSESSKVSTVCVSLNLPDKVLNRDYLNVTVYLD